MTKKIHTDIFYYEMKNNFKICEFLNSPANKEVGTK